MKNEDKYIRLYADFENYKKRCKKDKNDLILYSNEKLILEILIILDDLKRSINYVKTNELLYNNLLNILKQNNVKEIDCIGDDFDSHYHDAITSVDSHEKNKIIKILQPGYTLHNKIIRHPKVVIGK
jgi:molecular chaperone GrpE